MNLSDLKLEKNKRAYFINTYIGSGIEAADNLLSQKYVTIKLDGCSEFILEKDGNFPDNLKTYLESISDSVDFVFMGIPPKLLNEENSKKIITIMIKDREDYIYRLMVKEGYEDITEYLKSYDATMGYLNETPNLSNIIYLEDNESIIDVINNII